MKESEVLKKLNVGCGLRPVPGFVNLDKVAAPGVDVVFDLETCGQPMHIHAPVGAGDGSTYAGTLATGRSQLPFPDNTFDRIAMIHVFEHIVNVIPLMTELWRVAKHGCELAIVTPYGSSDNADEDPTHVRRIFKDSYIYYTPLAYGKADYGVTCDWDYRRRKFLLDKAYFSQFENLDELQMGMIVATMRNVVKEFTAVLVAQKPAREIGKAEDPKPPFTEFKIA